jgi:hypothetical protein
MKKKLWTMDQAELRLAIEAYMSPFQKTKRNLWARLLALGRTIRDVIIDEVDMIRYRWNEAKVKRDEMDRR